MKNKLILCIAITVMLFIGYEQLHIKETSIAIADKSIIHITNMTDENLQDAINILSENIDTTIETITTQPTMTTTATESSTTATITNTTTTSTITTVITTDYTTTITEITSTESVIIEQVEPAYYEYSWSSDGENWYFEPSGWVLDNETYYTLCNCVANEAGSYWITEYDKALVCEVIYNRLHDWNYSTVHDVVAAPNQFSNSYKYINLTDQYYEEKINDQVINAVAFYCSWPEVFTEGYHSFTGDGYQNHFVP